MKQTVMIVDDDPSVLLTVRSVLKTSRIDCLTAPSGSQCLHHLKQGFKGLILLDVMMPLMDGWQTLRAMCHAGMDEGNLICMLTAVRNPPPEAADLKDRVVDYMRKPFDSHELIQRVQEYLGYMA
jgi:DNA-binding response OmpR family regulator